MNLGKRLDMALEISGLTVPEIARASKVPASSINALIRRDSERSGFTEKLLALIPAEKVNHDWVRTGEGVPEPIRYQGAAPRTHIVPAPLHSKGAPSASQMPIAREINTVLAEKVPAAPLRSWDHQKELPAVGDWVFVPKLGTIASTAGGKETMKAVIFTEDVQTFRADWIREDQLNPSALAWAQCRDASMESVISQGDHYVIDTSSKDIEDGRVYSLWFGSSERVRRVFRLPNGGLRLAPANNAFPTLDLSQEEALALQVIGRVVRRSGKGGL